MSKDKPYDVKVVVTSRWHGTVFAANSTLAEDAARDAFDTRELELEEEDITYVDVRPVLKTFTVTYALEQGFSVLVEAATAEDAEAIVEKQLADDHCALPDSQRGHFEGIVIDAQEVCP